MKDGIQEKNRINAILVRKHFQLFITFKNSHKRIHTGEKQFECKICKKAFSFFNSLKVHERSHTGEKPFKCKICNETFSYSHVLKNHEKIHTV